MRETKNDLVNTISDRTNVKLPIGLIVGGLVAFAMFGFAQWQTHLQYDDRRFNEEREFTANGLEKARDYTDAKSRSRYTSEAAAEHQKQVEQRFQDIKEKNDAEHRSLQRQLILLEKKCEHI